ncbi:MAG TPA: hypothetical protein VHD83_28520 [Puia sp.]|nr:hypothetical protein [Puia sp.]
MNSLDLSVFASLFRQACLKCFGHPLGGPLTETESKLLYNQVFEQTGLTIGWKSLKNYSLFVMDGGTDKKENPSPATLDTLARYVLGAPYTTETERKEREGHYPYWYRYKEQVIREGQVLREGQTFPGKGKKTKEATGNGKIAVSRRRIGWWVGLAIVIILLTLFYRRGGSTNFSSNFHIVDEDSLVAGGWVVQGKDSLYWSKRGEDPGSLTLFTLKGDNWPDSAQGPMIHNLLLHPLPCDCWTLEVHLKDFLPRQNWQQAGILLLEDSTLTAKSMRISFAYNDYNGGFPRSGNIHVQAITSLGNGLDKPEEIAHVPLLQMDSVRDHPLILRELTWLSLRIEKQGKRFRILYADGVSENTSFKEVVSHEFAMAPRWVGLFALRGFVDSAAAIPARFRFFSLQCDACGRP